MPQILRKPNDTITLTVDASVARAPTAVVLPTRGDDPGEAESVFVSPKTNDCRFSWDAAEGTAVPVASSFRVGPDCGLAIPIPRFVRDSLKRHVVAIVITTALPDGDTITISDGENSRTWEADAANNGVGAGNTELGTNAVTAADQSTALAAGLLAWSSGANVRGAVDVESTTTVLMMATDQNKTITVTASLTTGAISVIDYGRDNPILYVLSETTSTAVSVGAAEA